MLDTLIQNLIKIKQDFAKNYSGSAHIQEVIPSQISNDFPINENNLKQLHKFAEKIPFILILLKRVFVEYHVLFMRVTLMITG